MTGPTNTDNEAPRDSLSAPESLQDPEVGTERRPGAQFGPQTGAQGFEVDGVAMVDAGPPHNGPLCFGGPAGEWLCRQRADNGHSDHIPYVEGDYLRPAPDDGPTVAEAAADDEAHWNAKYDRP